MELYDLIKKELKDMIGGMPGETIKILSANPLSPEEAIGIPNRTDFPILKGKEFMVEATFRGAKGHAFTDMPGNFQGSLSDFLNMSFDNNFKRSLLISGFNAIMRYFGRTNSTIHCKNDEPKICAEMLPDFIKKNFGKVKIAFIGYQPAMIESLVKSSFTLRVVDLDKDNIGTNRLGVLIEEPEKTKEILEWGDLIFATGSTWVNGTVINLLGKKQLVFYGVTASGICSLQGYRRYCPFGK